MSNEKTLPSLYTASLGFEHLFCYNSALQKEFLFSFNVNDKVKHNDEDHSCAHCEARDRKKFIYFIGMTSALAGLLFGMDQGVITGALPFLVKEFHLGPVTKGMVVSFLFIGALARNCA